jgi:hypothetical protein
MAADGGKEIAQAYWFGATPQPDPTAAPETPTLSDARAVDSRVRLS